MRVQLTPDEIAVLDRQDPDSGADGGWQSLLVGLQRQVERSSGFIELTADDLRRIPQYAFDYGNGGWERRLVAVFGRTLGARLGR